MQPARPRHSVVAALALLGMGTTLVLIVSINWLLEASGGIWHGGIIFFVFLAALVLVLAVWTLAWSRFGGIWIDRGWLYHRTWAGVTRLYPLGGRGVRVMRVHRQWALTLALAPISVLTGVPFIGDRTSPWSGVGRPKVELQGLQNLDFRLYRLHTLEFLRVAKDASARMHATAELFLDSRMHAKTRAI